MHKFIFCLLLMSVPAFAGIQITPPQSIGITDHGAATGLTPDDDHPHYSLLSSQAGAPSSTPSRVGEINTDLTADLIYMSTGAASSADWGQMCDVDSAQSLTNKILISTSNLSITTLTEGSILFSGAGGAVSEDNSNLFWDDSSNTLGIGLTNPVAAFHIQGTTLGLSSLVLENVESSAIGHQILFRKARGTVGAETAVNAADMMGTIQYAGYDGDSFENGTSIVGQATETWTDSARGSGLIFNTVDNGTTTPSASLVIDQTGFVGLGVAPTVLLHLNTNAADSVEIQRWQNTSGNCDIFRVTSDPEGSITASRCDLAIGIVANEGTLWIKEKGDSNNTGWKLLETAHFSNLLIHSNSTATVIDTANIAHFVQGLFADEISEDFTFTAGSTGPISAFADAGGGQVTVSDTAHGLSTGDIVNISGTTSYNDVFTIANALTNTFEITDTFVADDATGNWYLGDSVTADAGSAGTYKVSWSSFGLSAANNKDFEFNVFKNATAQNPLQSKRRFQSSVDIGALNGGGIIAIADGDIIAFAITGLTDTTNFTFEHVSLSLHKL